MKKWFRQISLVYKITFMITALLIIPTACICMFYFRNYENSLKEKAKISIQEEAARISNEVNGNLNIAENVFSDIAYSQELLYFLDDVNDPTEREMTVFFDSIQEKWTDFRYTYPNMFSQMIIYTSNKHLKTENNWKFSLKSMDDFPALDVMDQEKEIVFGAPKDTDGIVLDGMENNLKFTDRENLVLPAYLQIRNISTDRLIGVVELDMPLDKLIDSRAVKNMGNDNQFVLYDPKNRILFQTGDYDRNSRGILSDDCSFDTTQITGTVFVKESIAIRPARKMIGNVCIVAVLGIVCIMVLTYLVIKQMLNRLVSMDEMMNRIGTGDFRVQIADDGYGDEVSRIKQHFNQMALRLEEVIWQMIEKEKAQKDAELRALQAQINPHFLFNTLETMHMQCEIDRYYKIGDSLSSLGEIFRYTMKWNGHEVPFYMEWNNLKNYIAIMSLRLDDDFTYELNCTDDVQQIIVPKMLLQPLVENSFSHGFKGVPAPWHLSVSAKVEKEQLMIVIEDNGSGIAPDRLEDIRERMKKRVPLSEEENRRSIGVINVLQRMDMVCQEGSGIEISNRTEGGIRIIITIAAGVEHVSDINS